jgi:hypothetical protein
LDGDLYNLIPLENLPDFSLARTFPPGEYTSAPRKLLERPCTMEDVAEFFVEYINSDVRYHSTLCGLSDDNGLGPWDHRQALVDHCRSKHPRSK